MHRAPFWVRTTHDSIDQSQGQARRDPLRMYVLEQSHAFAIAQRPTAGHCAGVLERELVAVASAAGAA